MYYFVGFSRSPSSKKLCSSKIMYIFCLQISALAKKNKVLLEKCKRKGDAHIPKSYKGPQNGTELGFPKSSIDALTESSATDFQVGVVGSPKSV